MDVPYLGRRLERQSADAATAALQAAYEKAKSGKSVQTSWIAL